MQNTVAEAGAVALPKHPLDPLTPDEIRRAAAAVRATHDLGAGMMFETISLHEPDKRVVHDAKPGATFAREAFVCAFDRTNGKVFEARVDLVANRVVDWQHVPGVRPRILIDDITLVGEVARADPRFRAALAKRGITDIEKVQVDPWSAGNYGLPDEEGRRLSHTFCWYRNDKHDNGYAHPIEGLCAVIDLDRAEVLRVDDYGEADVPMQNRNYAARYRTAFRDDVKPLEIVQPAGPSFVVDGNEVRWQKWRFRVGFNAREGLVLHTVGYEDDGRLRPVLHRAALSEMVVPYGHPGGGHFRKNAFDVGEYGIGVLANSLTLGCDCLGAIRYFDAWLADSKGDPYCIESAVCLHEEDFGILWKHTDLFTGEVDVRRARRLVVSSISTVGNYEYGSFWYFHQDGSIHFEMKATGILNTAGLRPGESPDYGTIVSPGVYAHYHQHIFNMRLDMAVDGESNRVVEVDTVALPVGPDNPHGNAFTIRETVLGDRAERAAQRRFQCCSLLENRKRRSPQRARTAHRLQAAAAQSGADLLRPAIHGGQTSDLHDAAAMGDGLSSRRDFRGRPLSQPERRRRRVAGLDRRRSSAGRYGYRDLALFRPAPYSTPRGFPGSAGDHGGVCASPRRVLRREPGARCPAGGEQHELLRRLICRNALSGPARPAPTKRSKTTPCKVAGRPAFSIVR